MRAGFVPPESAGRLVAVLFCVLLASNASAQQTASAITGIVRDTSGGVLPGVTVEAASPALIEQVRTVYTDGQGRYNIVDLRPGAYVVTFILPGFSTVIREGIVLTAGFTASVNADLQIGSVEETITVSGAAPLVDTANIRKQTVLSREQLDTLPTSTKNLNTVAVFTPGFASDLSRDSVGAYTTQVGGGTYHGKGGSNVTFDGMGIQHSGGNMGYTPNTALVDEVTLSTSGITAESNADGAVANMVPKEGGNTFSGTASGLFSGSKLQASPLNDELRSRGLTTVNKVVKVWDATFALGGPIKRDKVWFFASFREWGSERQGAGKYWNKTQGTMFYTPDFDRPATGMEWYESKAIRVTWQASQKNKFNFFMDRQRNCNCHGNVATTAVNTPEATLAYHFTPNGLYQVTWSSPMTSRLLLEAGAGWAIQSWPTDYVEGVTPNDISIFEQSTGLRYNSSANYRDIQDMPRYTQRFSASYVTGSHNFKVGIQLEQALRNLRTIVNQDMNYRFNNGIPNQITQHATPYFQMERNRDMGLFAQDQWAVGRMTINYGVRFDYIYGWIPHQTIPAPASGWVPAREFDEIKAVPSWKDLSPRGGVVYDIFGDGRTALKVTMGRYVAKTSTAITAANNPVTTSVNSINRVWNDANGNYVPDCDLANGAQQDLRASGGDLCGPWSDQNFGGLNVTTEYADDVLRGWGVRGYNWDFVAEVQQQVSEGMSVTAGYYRNWYGNFTVSNNILTTPADYDSYCITAPVDSRLPGGGGYQICDLADISPAKFGQSFTRVEHASNYGDQQQLNEFFGATINLRLGNGGRLGGGIDLGRTVLDSCFVVNSVQDLLYCRDVKGFGANTQIKFNGSYPLPGNFLVSGVIQNVPGSVIEAEYAAPNAIITPSLGRNLAACGGSAVCNSNATVPLVGPNELYNPRANRIDMRLAKRFQVRANKVLSINLDVFNVMNQAVVLGQNNTFGGSWQRPTQTMDGRMFQFSSQFTF